MKKDPGHLTEFYKGYTGTCGQCALEEAMAAAENRTSSEDDMVAIVHEMQQHGQLSAPNGASTLWALAREAERRGFKIATEWDYSEPFNHDWHKALLDNVGKKPIVIQLARGRYLKDVETGAADESTLNYHFICILDAKTDGYVVNDGDNPQVLSRYQVYNYGTLMNAVPCGLLILEPKETPKPVSNVPTGWHDDGTTLMAPNKGSVHNGFRLHILSKTWDATCQPKTGEFGVDGGTSQDFRRPDGSGIRLTWTPKTNVTESPLTPPPPPSPKLPSDVLAVLVAVMNHFAEPAQLYASCSELVKKYQ